MAYQKEIAMHVWRRNSTILTHMHSPNHSPSAIQAVCADASSTTYHQHAVEHGCILALVALRS